MVIRAIRRRVDFSRLPRLIGLVGVIALVFGAGSVFGALGSSTAQTFYGCIRVGGLLTNVTTHGPVRCGPLSQPVSWGAQGAPGPAGPSGATGPAGANGLSHGYVVHTGVTDYATVQGSASLTVATLSGLPAGTYMVTASETATLPHTVDSQFPVPGGVVTCSLAPGGSHSQQGVVLEGIVGVYTDDLAVTIPDAVTVAEGESITLTCTAPPGTSSDNAVITAIAVDAVN